jgi:hydroxyethylthiazole kinase-like uncharacterized protein yjeF
MDASGEALSRRQVRDLDRLAIEQWGVPGVVLMENAGRNATDAIEQDLGEVTGKKLAIIAGSGNNGGDGFVIARHLHLRGSDVAVFVVGDAAKMAPDAAVNFGILEKLKIQTRLCTGEALGQLADHLRGFDLVVDAVGGTGISGPLRGDARTAVEQINAAGRDVVAVDIPTGLDCDTGQAHEPTVKAVLTVTFAARKIGFDADGAAG